MMRGPYRLTRNRDHNRHPSMWRAGLPKGHEIPRLISSERELKLTLVPMCIVQHLATHEHR